MHPIQPRPFLLLALSLLLLGCEATQYTNQGDQAMAAGRPHEALANYQRALQYDATLRNKPDFAAKLTEATWQSAFADGQAQSAIANWERAIPAFETAVANNPSFAPAIDGLAKAKVGGAQGRYERALTDADKGDLKTAQANLNQALLWDSTNAGARAALDSIARRDAPSASEQRYAASLKLVEAKQWDQVASETAAIVTIDQNHLPARALLFRAKAQLAESRQVHELASQQFANKRFDDAIVNAQKSLAIWSTNPDAADLLNRAQAKRNEAEQHYVKAQKLADDGDFDAALAAMGDCLDVYPFHPAGATFMRQTRLDGAATYVAEGHKQLSAGKLDDASKAFRNALRYVPDDGSARDGLVEVAFAQGQGAEKEGLWGNALLWYLDAVAQRPKNQKYVEAERRARAAIGQKVAFTVSLDVKDSTGRDTNDASALEARAATLAAKAKPEYVTLQTDPDAKPRGPLYRAAITMQSIQIQQDLVSKDRKEHLFTGYRPVPNQNIPQLESQLVLAERDLAFTRRNLIRTTCSFCNGRGRYVCNFCRGSRQEACHSCGGRGKVNIKGVLTGCNACGSSGRTACNHCHNGHIHCNRCGSKGFFLEVDSFAVRNAERNVSDLRYRLSREPVTVQEQYQVRWPYEQETYRKVGGYDAAVRIDDPTGTQLQSFDLAPRFNQTDSVVLNPAPQYGLQPDDLKLPPDETVYGVLIEDGASQLARNALAAAAVARANGFIAEANDHAKAGKADLDIEARMAAMVLLESVKPADARKILDDIRGGK